MKRTISALLLITMFFLSTACGGAPTDEATPPGENSELSPTIEITPSPTPGTEEYPVESVRISDLGEYVIVYPSDYTEYRMQEVQLLRDVIKHITGKAPQIVPDTAPEAEREIIIASSSRETKLDDKINSFQHGADYIIAVSDGDIILGGNNFYADVRAIYDFYSNRLGYDDIDDRYYAHSETVSGVSCNLYQKPPLIILGNNGSVSAFTEQYAIRDMRDANFNFMAINEAYYTQEQLQDLLKWCARYGISLMFVQTKERYLDIYKDCPMVWGHALMDEPQIANITDCRRVYENYIEKYSHYGEYEWKPFLNQLGFLPQWNYISEFDGIFEGLDMMSFDRYFGHSVLNDMSELFSVYEMARDFTAKNNQELWTYIQSFNIVNENQNASKMLRWQSYVSLCFGAKAILYFQYGDASKNHTIEGDWSFGSLVNWDFTKNDAWYCAKDTNAELLKVAEMLKDYVNVGAYTVNVSDMYPSAYLENPYHELDSVLCEILSPAQKRSSYLVGCFDKINSDGNAFIIMNIDDLDSIPYDETHAQPARVKINGENVKFYREGELQSVPKDDEGYYLLEIGNGHCWFVEVE